MIELKNISKKFGSRQLFSDTNLHFEGGKIYALIGTSGCGKTTLLNMIGRLEPYDKGQIIYDGTSLKDIKPSVFFRDYLGYLFQDFGLIESQTVKENLNLGLVGKKLKEKEKISLMKQALNRVNLSYLDLKQPIFELSGGEAQRVALAKIILKDPPLILADEPTASLDPKNSEELLSILESLKNPNRIIIIATHNPLIWEQVDQVIRVTDLSHR
ncbi:ABC transporter ATP-binding protein [uncultured Streptococcus sp.]|uniref:ABC transporter ATP-binding protein n=1 Tax=uncultured Streptococcus sp. TaxID=83427 RepID=UPI00288AFF48|nr:ABC transporter ATP-binding protein [uncultured Streptococcus sp.]